MLPSQMTLSLIQFCAVAQMETLKWHQAPSLNPRISEPSALGISLMPVTADLFAVVVARAVCIAGMCNSNYFKQ